MPRPIACASERLGSGQLGDVRRMRQLRTDAGFDPPSPARRLAPDGTCGFENDNAARSRSSINGEPSNAPERTGRV